MFGRTTVSWSVLGVLLLLFGIAGGRAEGTNDAALVKALEATQVTLEDGLKTSEAVGVPISAKFEIENGRLQLSVYAVAGDEYKEIVISPGTGVLMSAQKITDNEDLADATAQKKAMQNARVALRTAVEAVAASMPGSRGVSAVPEPVDGQPVAKVKVLKAGALTTSSQDLR